MLDATAKKLLRLLDADRPVEVRRAAAVVLAEVAPRDAEVAKAVRAALTDEDAAVRSTLLVAAGTLKIEAALPELLTKIEEGGQESELAAQAAAKLGAKATKALQDLMHKVAPGLRRRIAGALATAGAASAGGAGVDALLDKDPGVVEAAARSLAAEVPALDDKQRTALTDHLLELMKGAKKSGLPRVTEAAVVRLLASLGDARAEALFWDRLGSERPVEVRVAALGGVGKSAAEPTKERLKRLLNCAADRDFRVAGPALMLLAAVPVADKLLPEWLALFDAPDVAARRAALDMLANRDTPEVAAALLRQLKHPDRNLREETLKRMVQLGEGRKALAEATLAAETVDAAWALARSQEPFAKNLDEELRDSLFRRACDYVEAADRRADPLLFLLRAADPTELRDRLEKRGVALRKKKQYDKALVTLRLLTRDPACAAPMRLEAAGCALKLSPRDLSHDTRTADRCLEEFARLIHNHEAETVQFVADADWLEPDELFYLGFHFAERERDEKKFGAAALRQVVARSGRTKIGKDAKSKLRSEGIEE